MPEANAVIKSAVAKTLKDAGFLQNGTTWYSDRADTILVVQLQKSRYSSQYYINAAVWVKKLGPASTPREPACHIRRRAGGAKLEAALNGDDVSLDSAQRERQIAAGIKRSTLSFLTACESLGKIRELLATDKLNNALVCKEVWNLVSRKPT